MTAIGRTLGHYRLDALIGAGGMGEVYRASDLALGRTAAVKVLPAGVAPELRQVLRHESEAGARLQHPAIASIYEAGEDGGVDFIAMEFVAGETLRARLRRGSLPADEATAIAAGILEGLAHAHAAGVIHRDVKPENVVLVERGRPKILDFGIARRLPSGDDPTMRIDDSFLAAQSAVAGTAGYMAPEQLRGQPVDGRADLFAVGATLFEMLAGCPAFPGSTITERIAATLSEAPAALPVAAGLNAILARALERDRERRYPTARDFLRDLAGLADGEALSSLPNTVAVLDFEWRADSGEESWVCGAIAESLAADLARAGLQTLPRARVARASAATADRDPARIGLLLGCRWVVHGSVQRIGPALRAVMTVSEVHTGRDIASSKVNGVMTDLFALQDRLAEDAAAAMRVEVPTAPSDVPQLDAYECYVRGREDWLTMQKAGFESAHEWFERAIELQPDYADALVGLAMVHDMRFTFTTDRAELEFARGFSNRALAAQADHEQAHVWLAYAMLRLGESAEAIRLLTRASDLDPRDAYARYFHGCLMSEARRFDDALRCYQDTVALAPEFGFGWLGLGNTHMELRAFGEADWCFAKAIQKERGGRHATSGAGAGLAESLRRQGRLDEARAEALAAVAQSESSDHMYRDTFRALGLCVLARTALEQRDEAAAVAACRQAETHLSGRRHTLGGGYLLVQAMACRARAENDRELCRRAGDLLLRRDSMDWSWFWLCTAREAGEDLASAARLLGV